MARRGQISVLVSDELQKLITVTTGLDRAVAARLRRETKQAAAPVWSEAMRGHAVTRLQVRVLSDTARVAVSDTNVTLKSGVVGKLRSGTPVSRLAYPVEQGADIYKKVRSKSSLGRPYQRTLGNAFGGNRRQGQVFGPAFRESVSRMASLWLQTTIRTTAEELEKGAS